jgi:hypothetical protein
MPDSSTFERATRGSKSNDAPRSFALVLAHATESLSRRVEPMRSPVWLATFEKGCDRMNWRGPNDREDRRPSHLDLASGMRQAQIALDALGRREVDDFASCEANAWSPRLPAPP